MENMRGDQVSAVDRFSGPTGLRELAAWMRACLHVGSVSLQMHKGGCTEALAST
jgi:hypothetical protein